jgi:sulfotransferase 6B1
MHKIYCKKKNLLKGEFLLKSSILVNSVPKCGTHLVNQIVRGIPAFSEAEWLWLLQNENFMSKLEYRAPGSVMLGHLYYSPELKEYLDLHHIPRFFIYRDPRDMVVSYVFHVLNFDPQHELRRFFTEDLKSDEERILKLVSGFKVEKEKLEYGDIRFHYYPFLPWLNDPGTCILRYEDLIKDPSIKQQTLSKMVDYLSTYIPSTYLEKSKLLYDMEKNMDPKKSNTFRRGKAGGWKDYFTDEIKRTFKSIAGEFLIDLGYEKDLNW